MAVQAIQLGHYDPDSPSGNVYGMNNMRYAKALDQLSWRSAYGFVDSDLGIDLTLGGNFEAPIEDLIEIITVGNEDRTTFLRYKNKGVYVRTGRAGINAVHSPSNVRAAPSDATGWPIQFNGAIYIVYSNGIIINWTDKAVLTTNLDVSGSTINAVTQWQGRVFISHGNQISWSDAFKITEWSIESNNLSTLAGFNIFPEAEIVEDISVFGNSFYVFTDDKIYIASTTGIDEQFTFTELSNGNEFEGGVVSFSNGIYYLAKTGVRYVAGNNDAPISDTLDDWLSLIQESDPEIISNYNEATDEIYWLFKGEGVTLILDVKDTTFRVEDTPDLIAFGQIGIEGKTIDELEGTYERLGGTIGSLGVSKKRAAAINSSGQIFFYGPVDYHSITFNFGRFSRGTRVFIREILIDDLSGLDYQVGINEGEDTIDFNDIYSPDRWGNVVIEKPYCRPNIKIIVNEAFDKINNIVINYTAENI